MIDMPCPDRTQFGALASGDLPAAEEAALRQHIAVCAGCEKELASLTSVVSALRSADLSWVDHTSSLPIVPTGRNLELAIFDRIDAERRRVRMRRLVVSVAASVLLIGGIVAGLALRSSPPGDGLYVAMNYPLGGKANVELTEKKWGTEIQVRTQGVPAGVTWGVWLERPDGSRVPAGSFTSVANEPMTLRLSSALQARKATAIGMTDFASKKEVRVLLSLATVHQG
jgi:Putative zinc-finger